MRVPRRRLAGFGIALAASYAELRAVALVLAEQPSGALIAHLTATLLACVGAGLVAARPGRLGDLGALVGAGLIVLCVPVVGLLTILTIALPAWVRRDVARPAAELVERPLPRFSEDALRPTSSAPVPPRTLSPDRGLEQRIAATKALRYMDTARAVPLLRRALQDPAEDVRLLAHAILDRRERRIRAALDANLARLAALAGEAAAHPARAALHAEVGSQLWELASAGFVVGEGAQDTLRGAAEHAWAACQAGGPPNAVLIAVRAQLALRQFERAEQLLVWASVRGVHSAQLAPLRAELAFLTRRFDRVAASLRTLPSLSRRDARLGHVTRFWQGRSRP